VPDEAEVQGLVALMEFQSSRVRGAHGRRRAADPAGGPEPDEVGPGTKFNAGFRAGTRRECTAAQRRRLGSVRAAGGYRGMPRGRPASGDTDWGRIVSLYDGLMQVAPSPVVELNRAVAGRDGRSFDGSRVGAADRRRVERAGRLVSSAERAWGAAGPLGRDAEAAEEFDRAAAMTDNEREQDVLADKAVRARQR